ncbi:MAG: hypothetical protein IPK52_02080 [Chloroflexi bacterium]|nr:hypothetical protein [Chloroflexota bacterium]
MKGLRQWLIDSYNGLYVIVLKPHMPTAVTIFALLFAMLFGLLFWGYFAAPVRYYDGAPYQLSPEYRDEWIKLVAAAKAANIYNDGDIIRYLQMVENPAGTVERLISSTTESVQAALVNLRPLVYDSAGQPLVGREAPKPGSIINDVVTIIVAVIATVILSVVVSLIWRILFKPNVIIPIKEALRPKTEEDARRKLEVDAIKERRALEAEMRKAAVTAAPTTPYGAPLLQRLAIYTKGRQFDESFAIENADNVFFGETGVTISKKLGDDVAAIEIWLFDKEDFVNQIVKIYASEKAFSTPEVRAELEEKVTNPATDIIVAKAGAVLTLETDRILVNTKLVEVKPTATAPNSTFEGLTLQMEGWSKGTSLAPASTQPMAAPQPVAAYQPITQSAPPKPIIPAAPQPLPTYQPPAPPVAPYTPPMATSTDYTPPMISPAVRPAAAPPPPRPTPIDDDPFGGTADFDPITD